MIKTCYLLFLVCFSMSCFAQANDSYYGVVLTQISMSGAEVDTIRLLYCRNVAGDRLTAYTFRQGIVAAAIAYQLTGASDGLLLFSKPLLPGQVTKDSLGIEFQDKAHTVVINRRDHYILFPNYYARVKQEIGVKHSIIALLNLLSDAIGDYPISSTLPLLTYTPQLDQQIQRATILTQRNQADMKDTWTCLYYYNRHHLIDSVKARSSEEVRFTKKVRYQSFKPTTIMTYLNIEDRQVTNRTSRYDNKNRHSLNWHDSVNELGKNRETATSVTQISHDMGQLRNIEPSTAEVLQLLKPLIIKHS